MLEDKLDTLTKEVVALRLAIEAGGGTGTAAAGKAATGTAKKKPAAVEPEHDADEVGTTMRKAAKKDKPAVQKFIKSKKCADLAELLTKPELLDEAFTFAEGVLEAEDAEDDDDV